MRTGEKVKDSLVDKVIERLAPHLLPGENIELLIRTNKLSPLLDAIVVTDGRVLALHTGDVLAKGPRIQFPANQVRELLIDKRFTGTSADLLTVTGQRVSLGALIGGDADGPLLRDAVHALRTTDVSDRVSPARQRPAASGTGGGGLAEEIGKLAALHAQGILDDAEFAAAKQATIARHSGT
jgi:hypothetical protein